MSVKRSKSGTRILGVLEQIAENQPIGVSELARLIDADKSAVQRAIMTLADEGWVHVAPGAGRRWQLTGHIHLVAHMARGSNSLRQRALPALTALRDATGETVALIVPDIGRLVIVEVLESRQLLRTAPHVGMMVVTGDSATGHAMLPYLTPERQEELLGGPVGSALREGFEETIRAGYAVSADAHGGASINIAAPIFEMDGWPEAALLLSAPRERMTPDRWSHIGTMVVRTARELSLARPRPAPLVVPTGREYNDREGRTNGAERH